MKTRTLTNHLVILAVALTALTMSLPYAWATTLTWAPGGGTWQNGTTGRKDGPPAMLAALTRAREKSCRTIRLQPEVVGWCPHTW